ncbi:uncharacterized protein LOC125749505 isoform X2 [Brienomyrus brachyistius]|uniref:uncharacterized protein LOC125749505 isoform X2 n=1 Tax=Brienomyrus brachyistius TaxID=42636 RepID=UPI0020B26EBB|nr:uncharacterized protein LOC125749505 isoform X2 [Brienomyrus brachyistius]
MAFNGAMPVDRGHDIRRVCWVVFIGILFSGSADCDLSLTVQSPPTVIATAGSNAILSVSFAGAQNPIIEWAVGALPIVIWTSPNPPDIDPNYLGVVSLMPNGSLVFSNVPQNYSANYIVSITKTGFLPKTGNITLQVLAQPVCSVQSSNTNLNYTCQTPGNPNSLLSFPQLNQTVTKNGSLSLVVPATDALNGMQILCVDNQMNINQTCSVTASRQPKYPAPSAKKEISERHLPLPSTGTPSPVRMATTV